MELNPDDLKPREMYQWLVHTVLPRPIAWVSTVNRDGLTNLAPFSFFAAVCARPPTLMFCPANDRFGRAKDTLRNVEATGEFVINLVSEELATTMNATAASLPQEESEFARFGIESTPSGLVKPPRVTAAPVAFECRLHQIVRFGDGPIAGNAVFGTILRFHVRDEILGPNGQVDVRKFAPLARLGGENYARLGEILRLERPERDNVPAFLASPKPGTGNSQSTANRYPAAGFHHWE